MLVVQAREAREELEERVAVEALERQADKLLEMVAPAEAGVVVALLDLPPTHILNHSQLFLTPPSLAFFVQREGRVAAVQALQIQGKMAFQELPSDQALLLLFKITLIKCLVGIMMHFP